VVGCIVATFDFLPGPVVALERGWLIRLLITNSAAFRRTNIKATYIVYRTYRLPNSLIGTLFIELVRFGSVIILYIELSATRITGSVCSLREGLHGTKIVSNVFCRIRSAVQYVIIDKRKIASPVGLYDGILGNRPSIFLRKTISANN